MSATAARPGSTSTNGAGRRSSSAPGVETLLSDAALGSGPRMLPGWPVAKTAGRLALRPQRPVRRGLGFAAELGRIALGRSEMAPSKKDKRFEDDAWDGNPAFRRLCQAYLAVGEALDGAISDADLDWRSERRVRFAVENLLDALAPTNFLLTNPAALKATLDTGGGNLLRGARALARDMVRPPRIPRMVDSSEFAVGENMALSPGSVVLRTPVLELIQYQPVTARVNEVPVLVVPPQINRFYVLDIAPGRSMVEHIVGSGHQAFVISWRNPDERHAHYDLETYVESVLEALEAVESISGSDRTHVLGMCAGGMTASIAAAHLAARGELDRLAGLTLGVTLIDNDLRDTTGAFLERNVASLAEAEVVRKGYLDGSSLAGVFAFLRPNELVWAYVVNNYLLGKDPPAFDVLAWNADTTRLPAGLHHDFMEIAMDNQLAEPGGRTVLGTPVDMGAIDVDTYVMSAIADHLVPWQTAYRTVHLLGSEPRFVLSNSGHVAAIVNPPGNEKASFHVAGELPETADEWLQQADQRQGTWWVDWTDWLGKRSGAQRPAPKRLGNREYPPLGDAPGEYVLEP